MPKEKEIKRSCCSEIAVRKNVRNLEKLVRRNCVMLMCCLVMLLFTDTHVHYVEILDEMENCDAGG